MNDNDTNAVVTNVLSAIEVINACNTLDELLVGISAFSKPLGFTHAGIGQIINPAVLDRPITEVGIADYPDEFYGRWLSQGYIMHDPILRYALSYRAAFTWREAYEYATRYGRRIFDEAKEFGLVDGVAIPVIVGHYPTGLVSLVHPKPNFAAAEIAHIQLVCIHSYTRMLRIINAEKKDRTHALTVREIDVLHYVAAGKTNWEIGRILDISEDTIKMHMKNITRKLDAANRAHSVALGIREGQILP